MSQTNDSKSKIDTLIANLFKLKTNYDRIKENNSLSELTAEDFLRYIKRINDVEIEDLNGNFINRDGSNKENITDVYEVKVLNDDIKILFEKLKTKKEDLYKYFLQDINKLNTDMRSVNVLSGFVKQWESKISEEMELSEYPDSLYSTLGIVNDAQTKQDIINGLNSVKKLDIHRISRFQSSGEGLPDRPMLLDRSNKQKSLKHLNIGSPYLENIGERSPIESSEITQFGDILDCDCLKGLSSHGTCDGDGLSLGDDKRRFSVLNYTNDSNAQSQTISDATAHVDNTLEAADILADDDDILNQAICDGSQLGLNENDDDVDADQKGDGDNDSLSSDPSIEKCSRRPLDHSSVYNPEDSASFILRDSFNFSIKDDDSMFHDEPTFEDDNNEPEEDDPDASKPFLNDSSFLNRGSFDYSFDD